MNLHALARLIVRRRIRAGAPPATTNPHYERDPVASRTDRMFKKCLGLAGFLHLDLDVIAALAGTDKFGAHEYVPVYEALMCQLRRKPISLLELGVGGYSLATGGESLRMWAAYFPKGRIYGIDISDKTQLSQGRIRVFQCSQTDRRSLTAIAKDCGPFDFIVDDGSHSNQDQIESFGILWPFVKNGGAYVIEDVQTSYWPRFGGGPPGSSAYHASCIAFFKTLVDSVNSCEFLDPPIDGPTLDRTIGSITFRHNLIIVEKDRAGRRSNFPLTDPNVRAWLLSLPSGGDLRDSAPIHAPEGNESRAQ